MSGFLLWYLMTGSDETPEEHKADMEKRWQDHLTKYKAMTPAQRKTHDRNNAIQVYGFFIVLITALLGMVGWAIWLYLK